MNTRLTPTRAAVAITLGVSALLLDSSCAKPSSSSPPTGTCVRNVSVDNVSALEGSVAGAIIRTNFEFTLSSTGCAAGGSLGYHVDVHSGSASAIKDFDVVSGTVDFAAGNMDNRVLLVPVIADVESEPDEQFYICLKAPGFTSVSTVPIAVTTDYGVGTILNDDGPPRLSAGPGPTTSPPTTDELHCSR